MRTMFIVLAGVFALAQTPAISLPEIYNVSESETVSENHMSRPLVDYDDLIMLLSNYAGTNGTISDLYLQYFKGVLSWSSYGDHYVAFSSSYVYNGSNTRVYYVIAVGDLTYNAGTRTFSGSGVDVYKFYPNADQGNGYINYSHVVDNNFSYTFSGSITFTDLSSAFPDLRSQSTRYLYVILSVMALMLCYYTFTKFGWRNASKRRHLR